MPDTFLDRADEVINVDVTVEELRKRLREGKIYRADKVEQALANFFRMGNLSTLRELALRAVADEVGDKAARYRAREGLEPALIPERVMVCMSSNAMAPRVIRTGARIAGRLGARWYAVYVETPGETPGRIRADAFDALQRTSRLAESLALRSYGSGPSGGRRAHRLAHREVVTHVIFGQSARSRWDLVVARLDAGDRFLGSVATTPRCSRRPLQRAEAARAAADAGAELSDLEDLDFGVSEDACGSGLGPPELARASTTGAAIDLVHVTKRMCAALKSPRQLRIGPRKGLVDALARRPYSASASNEIGRAGPTCAAARRSDQRPGVGAPRDGLDLHDRRTRRVGANPVQRVLGFAGERLSVQEAAAMSMVSLSCACGVDDRRGQADGETREAAGR